MCLWRMWSVSVRGGEAYWRPLVGQCGMPHGIKVLLVFHLCVLQAVLADLSTLKVMPLIQIFLYATTI